MVVLRALSCFVALAVPICATTAEQFRGSDEGSSDSWLSLLQGKVSIQTGDVGTKELSVLQTIFKSDLEKNQSQELTKAAESADSTEKSCEHRLSQVPSNSPRSFDNFDHGSDYSGLFVNKDAKFAFCVIEMNVGKQWTAIANKLHTGNLNVLNNYGIAHETWSAEVATQIFRDSSATRAVFVRDPLERFLSAFLNKCLNFDCYGICPMRTAEQQGKAIPFSQAVAWLQTQDPAKIEPHWKLQSRHCELYSRVSEYTDIAIMSNESAETASCLLDKAGLSYVNVQSSEPNSPRFFQDLTKAEYDYVPDEVMASFYTPSSAQIVMKAFEEDYKTFKLPVPGWVPYANGKFFSDTKSNPCHITQHPISPGLPLTVTGAPPGPH